MHKTKPGGQAVSDRRSATVSAVTGTPRSTSTCISAGQLPRQVRSSSMRHENHTLWALEAFDRQGDQNFEKMPGHRRMRAEWAKARLRLFSGLDPMRAFFLMAWP
jgi:hypothetical protein